MRPQDVIKETSAARKAREARAWCLGESFKHGMDRLARLVPVVVWTPAGTRPVPVPAIHHLLNEARRHHTAQRWQAARAAYDAADELVQVHSPALRAARQRNRLEELEKTQAEREIRLQVTLPKLGNEAKSRKATKRAKPYVKAAMELRERHKTWKLTRVAKYLEQAPPRFAPKLDDRQIYRHLRGAGLR